MSASTHRVDVLPVAKSGHEGIRLIAKSGLFRARLKMLGRTHDCGEFVTIEEAVTARGEEFERLNAVRSKAREAAK